MSILELFRQLSTVVQLALIIGAVAVIFLLACSRQAGENLVRVVRALRSQEHAPSKRRGRRRIE